MLVDKYLIVPAVNVLLAEVKQDNKLDVVVANNSFVFEIVWHLKLIIYNFKKYLRRLNYDFYQHTRDYT